MLPLRLTVLSLIVVILAACGLPVPNTAIPEVATPATGMQPRAPLLLITNTALTAAVTPTVATLASEGYPAPRMGTGAYPEPLSTEPPGYPGPLATPLPTPTRTPNPFPLVSTLPAEATWFFDADDISGQCGIPLYAQRADGTIVVLEETIAGVLSRPNATPLLLWCAERATTDIPQEIALLDPVQNTLVPFQQIPALTNFTLSTGALSPDGQYLLLAGALIITESPDRFSGLYRVDLTSGEVIRFADLSDFPVQDGEVGRSSDIRIPVQWDETGVSIHSFASMFYQSWHLMWDENAALPYSFPAGSLTVEALGPVEPLNLDEAWPLEPFAEYTEAVLPADFTRPIRIYMPAAP